MASKIIVDQLEKTGGALTALTLPVANATANQYLKNDGAGALSWGTLVAGFNSMIVYTGSTDWVKSARPAGITKVIVEVQGGGGGGSYHAGTSFIGGSAGGYAKKVIDVSSVTQAVITIGIGGPGATGTGLGTDGGDSRWLDTAYSGTSDVKGIKGVSAYSAYGTAIGGLGSGGDINIQGGAGGPYSNKSGGDSMFGHGGWNGWTAENTPQTGAGYGSGGGGGYNVTAGAGAPGIIIVWEFL
jgi:hypothetical protein